MTSHVSQSDYTGNVCTCNMGGKEEIKYENNSNQKQHKQAHARTHTRTSTGGTRTAKRKSTHAGARAGTHTHTHKRANNTRAQQPSGNERHGGCQTRPQYKARDPEKDLPVLRRKPGCQSRLRFSRMTALVCLVA